MNNGKFALVVPNNRLLRPDFCSSYYANFTKFHKDILDVKLFVVDDYSHFVRENLKALESSGIPFEYWTVSSQVGFFKENFGNDWKKYWSIIPHRTDASRSFGYLVAALWGADVIITVDDDNYAIGDSSSVDYDYLGAHDIVNSETDVTEVSSTSNWFNTISMLQTEPERELYARGYPYSRRFGELRYSTRKRKLVMNVGLWIGDPDVDSITILNEGSLDGLPKSKTVNFRSQLKRLVLAKDTFAPLNTANTAYSRKLLPIIYDTFQGTQLDWLKLDRFGDIWCNLFVKKIIDQTGEGVAVGIPLVRHRKEPRNTFDDFEKEFLGLLVSEKLIQCLEQIQLDSGGYANLYQELVEGLRENLKKLGQIPSLARYFDRLFTCMQGWLDAVEKLGLP